MIFIDKVFARINNFAFFFICLFFSLFPIFPRLSHVFRFPQAKLLTFLYFCLSINIGVIISDCYDESRSDGSIGS